MALAAVLLAAALALGPSARATPSPEPVPASLAPPPAAPATLAQLRREIARHDELYFRHATPEISDSAYDALKRDLLALESAHPATALAPSLGDDRAPGFPRAAHRVPMLGLDKAYTEAEVRAFVARCIRQLNTPSPTFVIEPKYDGLALSVTYEHGQLVRAATRGNGREGDDVTAQALLLPSLPRQLRPLAPDGRANPLPVRIELRGEVFVSLSDFARLNRQQEAAGEPPFAHPRNLAAGSLKQRDPRAAALRPLSLAFYGLGDVVPADSAPASQQALHRQLRDWGLPALDEVRVATSADEVWAAVRSLGAARASLPYPTDGVVVKLDAHAAAAALGASDTAPRSALAYKFAPARTSTTLRSITWQVGRTGVLTPVAELAPVRLAGAMIARATLHNRAELARLDLRPGDTVFLEKAGEIIPAIVGVDLAARPAFTPPYSPPTHCPSCTLPVSIEGPALRCLHPRCPAQLRRQLAHFTGKSGLAIPGFGPALLDRLVSTGLVAEIPDLYRLDAAALTARANVSRPQADRLLAALSASRQAELSRLISALGLPSVGLVASRDLARRHGTLDALIASGAVASPQHRQLLRDLRDLGFAPDPAPPGQGPPLTGKVFVLTGTLPTLSRANAIARIESAGGTVASAVSSKTDYVVAGASPGAKLARAETLGLPILDETALLDLLDID